MVWLNRHRERKGIYNSHPHIYTLTYLRVNHESGKRETVKEEEEEITSNSPHFSHGSHWGCKGVVHGCQLGPLHRCKRSTRPGESEVLRISSVSLCFPNVQRTGVFGGAPRCE